MNFYVLPGWRWILAAMGLYLFYAANRSNNIRRKNRRKRMSEQQNEFLRMLRKKPNEQLDEDLDSTRNAD